ncbi:hypothetical protein [Roseateles sp.]|uniref:hypothetical protein n=1 Tax=Roseateles sp. TaxID=1971397 RepID=UPI002F3F7426
MNRLASMAATFVIVAVLSACARQTMPIEGRWKLNVSKTTANAQSLGLPADVVEDIRNRMGVTRLKIDRTSVTVSRPGVTDVDRRELLIHTKEGDCLMLSLKGNDGQHRYCRDGGHLIVKEPRNDLVFVYDRD